MTTTAPTHAMPRPVFDSAEPSDPAGMRVAAAAGVAFVALNVVTLFLAGAPPESDAPAAKVATYFADHSAAIRAQLLLSGLGIAALLWWSGTLWRLLSRAEDDRPRLAAVAGVSLAVGLTLALVSGAMTSTAAFRVEDVATTHLLWTLSFVLLGAAGFGIGVFLLAASTVFHRAQLRPRWITYVGWLAALLFFAGTAGTVTDAAGATTVALIAFLVWCVWILGVSVTMWRGTVSRAGAR